MINYKYIGSAHQGQKQRSRFITPAFEVEGKFYIQHIENEQVKDFNLIQQPNKELLSTPTREFTLSKSSPAFYCFNVNDHHVIEGTRELIEPELVKLLSQKKFLNIHSQLMVANFLNLYQKQIDLIALANEDLKSIGVSNEIDPNAPFQNKQTDLVGKIAHSISEKVEKFKQCDESIKEYDVACIKNNKVFFEKYEIELHKVLTLKNTFDNNIERTMGEILNKCFEQNHQSVEISKNMPADVVYFLLSCMTFNTTQNNIETNASTRPVKESILDIGITIDNQVVDYHPSTNKTKTDANRIKSLKQSVDEIINQFNLDAT